MNLTTRKTGFLGVFIMTAACAVAAQEMQPPATQPPTQTQSQNPTQVPVTPPPPAPVNTLDAAVVPLPLSMAELRRRRDAIDAMEGMLPTKVRAAGKDTMREIETLQQQPVNFLTNSIPRAHGFHLDGYGVFFYVEIPGVRSTVTSIFEDLQRRQQNQQQPRADRATERTALPFDANSSYTDAVKRQLIDAMLEYSSPLGLRPNEWLTIAARDGDPPLPTVIYESITMVVRARGADLAEFRAGRLSREEMLKRVEVRGF
jgi:hypothetical protein